MPTTRGFFDTLIGPPNDIGTITEKNKPIINTL